MGILAHAVLLIFRQPEKKITVIASRYEITAWQSPCRLGRLKQNDFRLPERLNRSVI
ncbi:MAG: hypothetical protein J5680_03290 [Neisseriaceae bacterium]|nr:hypothetical protein [Neisseriaceae bacterium]MBR5676182.1 hypothetical protein [Neisseriaceae bacterium]